MLSESADSLIRKGEPFQTIHLSGVSTCHSTDFTQYQCHLYCWVFYLKVWRDMEGGKAQERRAMPWKGRPSTQPSSACRWWIKPLWWQQNKCGLELWPAHPSQPHLRAAPSHIPLLLRVEIFPQHQLRLSFLQSGLIVSCPSTLSHSFCCCNLSRQRNWCEWVL